MRRLAVPAAVLTAFLAGAGLAGASLDDAEVVRELRSRQRLLLGDLAKIERARSDVLEIRRLRETGFFVINEEEKKMEKQGREDFHIFMERFRNDTLEVLEILDRAVEEEDYVDPLRRIYGKALDEPVRVRWSEEDLDTIIAVIEEGYGVRINVSGEMDLRRTVSLSGEMSLLAVMLQLENLYDAKFVVRDGHVWFVRLGSEEPPKGE